MNEKKNYIPLSEIDKIDLSNFDLSVKLPLTDETKKEMDFISDEMLKFRDYIMPSTINILLNEKFIYIKDKKQYKKDIHKILNKINICFNDDINNIITSYLYYNHIDYEKRYNKFYDIFIKSQNLFKRYDKFYIEFLNNKFKYDKEYNDYIKRCDNVKGYKWQYLELSYNYKKYKSFKKNFYYIELYKNQYKVFSKDLLNYINEPLEDLKNDIYISNKPIELI